jgi:hypothetical protein
MASGHICWSMIAEKWVLVFRKLIVFEPRTGLR